MARTRLILVAALTVLCASTGVGLAASPALGSHPRTHHTVSCAKSRHAHHGRHRLRSSSFHSGHRGRHVTRCGTRHHGVTHPIRHSTHPRPSSKRTHRSSAADTAGGCVDAGLAPSAANVERIRAAVLCLINRERSAHGESALRSNPRLEQAAQSHTESMAFGGYFEHVGPRGDTPLDRMRASGYIYSSRLGYAIAENLAWGTLSLGTPGAIVASWMASPGHRANILDAHFRDTAIGVSPHIPGSFGHGQPGGIYTEDFGVIIGG